MKTVYTLFGLSLLILLVSLATLYVQLSQYNQQLIINFSSPGGINFLGSKGDAFAIVFTGIGILVINIFLAKLFEKKEQFITILLAFFSVFFSLLLLLAILAIISVN